MPEARSCVGQSQKGWINPQGEESVLDVAPPVIPKLLVWEKATRPEEPDEARASRPVP